MSGSGVPEQLGAYRLIELLGRGGMGEVWRAEHLTLSRPAAVKVIRPEALGAADELARTALLRRFEREARATAVLTSPHTIALYDFGRGPDGTFYYAMELLNGLDLETLVKRFGPVEPARAAHLLMQACDSLAEAHEHGLIHRDIKPANLFTCRQGLTVDFLKVLDFGLVKPVTLEGEAVSGLTATRATTGTPAYMAPEVALGQEPIDGRVDVYGLGCVAYWLLTGARVFESENPMRMVLDHIQTPPPPPSSRTELPVPPDMEAIILSSLAKSPADRPSSAKVLRERLVACQTGEPWTSSRADQWWQLHLPERWARSPVVSLRGHAVAAAAEAGSPAEAGPAKAQAGKSAASAGAPAKPVAPAKVIAPAQPVGPSVPPATQAPVEPPQTTPEAVGPAIRPVPAEVSAARVDILSRLRNNFAHSTIDIEEYERRAEAVERARTLAELRQQVADLPALDSAGHALELPSAPEGALVVAGSAALARHDPAGAADGALVRVEPRPHRAIAIFSGVSRRGRWAPSRVVQAIAFFGGVDLDFREAVLQPGVTEVHVIAFMGGVNITVPEDLPVDVEGIGIFGGFDSRHVASSSGDPAETRLRVTGVAFLGGASVEGRPRRGEVAAEEGARVPARRDRRRRPRRHGHRDDD